MKAEVGAAFNEALSRLQKHLGADDAVEIMRQCLRMARTNGYPETPEELYRLGVMLEEHPLPVANATGMALKVKAILLGVKP